MKNSSNAVTPGRNVVVVGTQWEVADTEKIAYPKQMTLYQDTGFQGYEPKVQKSVQPKKSLARKS